MSNTRRKAPSRPGMNFQRGVNETLNKENAKGTRPTANPTSIQEVMTQVVLHICKKSIFFDTNLKVALYLGTLFLVSLIGDFAPFPKTYLARRDNLFNVYFVKMGWAWTLLLTTPFLCLTSLILCCGDRNRFLYNHLPRIVIATGAWFCWTKLFNIIEASYGKCNYKGFDTKSLCLRAGHFWHGFDISGHSFILVYASLVLIEEARPIVQWETIREHIRNEGHNRSTQEYSSTPLKNLDDEQFNNLKYLYNRFTPAVRLLFVAMTVLQLLWDIMLVGTMLYYHRMIEKFVGGTIAILTWFFTYRFWYSRTAIMPEAAGKGVFNYQGPVKVETIPLKRRSSVSYTDASGKPVPRFMGMPLYTAAQQEKRNEPTRLT